MAQPLQPSMLFSLNTGDLVTGCHTHVLIFPQGWRQHTSNGAKPRLAPFVIADLFLPLSLPIQMVSHLPSLSLPIEKKIGHQKCQKNPSSFFFLGWRLFLMENKIGHHEKIGVDH